MRLFKQAAFAAALMFVAVPVLWPVAAFAQEAAAGTIVVAQPGFLSQLLVAAGPALGLVISALLAFAANELRKRTGIEVEAKHREALQSALLNGVLYALQKAGWVQGEPTDRLLPMARGYVQGSVPDALKKFGIDVATSAGQAALDRLLTPKLPVPAGTVMPNGDRLVGRS